MRSRCVMPSDAAKGQSALFFRWPSWNVNSTKLEIELAYIVVAYIVMAYYSCGLL